MSDSGGGRRLSRRGLVLGAAAVGVAATTGARTLAFTSDEERLSGAFSAGSLDLQISWDGASPDLGSLRETGETRQRHLSIVMPERSDPAYVWLRTNCPQCTDVENAVRVSFDLETTAGTEALFDGTLREARMQFGPGRRLSETLHPGQTWRLVVTCELVETLASETDAEFQFDFYAVQSPHVDDPETVAPDWSCDAACTSAISWVAFGGTGPVDETALTFELDDPVTLKYDLGSASASVSVIALKHGDSLDVFGTFPDSGRLEAGTGETFEQQELASEDTGPRRSEADPFPEHCWTYKHHIGDESGDITNECET